jgi:hypothetical protein
MLESKKRKMYARHGTRPTARGTLKKYGRRKSPIPAPRHRNASITFHPAHFRRSTEWSAAAERQSNKHLHQLLKLPKAVCHELLKPNGMATTSRFPVRRAPTLLCRRHSGLDGHHTNCRRPAARLPGSLPCGVAAYRCRRMDTSPRSFIDDRVTGRSGF